MKIILQFVAFLCGFYCISAFGADADYLNHPKRTEWQAGGFYVGTFEDGTHFQMNLPYKTPKSIDAGLSASYWYPRRFSGNTIELIQSSSDNIFIIVAQSIEKNGNYTDKEIFKGSFSPDKTSAQGVWTHVTRNKKMNFSMRRVVEYKGVYISLSIQEEGYDPERPFVFSSVFPVFNDSKVDSWIRDFASYCEHDLECSNNIELAWYSKRMFSLSGSVWGYSKGMAHGNGFTSHKHYVTTEATSKLVSLDYFVSVSSGCLDNISKNIISSLTKQNYSRAESGYPNENNFLPTPLGIMFYFDPYVVGAYVEGGASAFVERKKIGKCLKYLPSYE